MSPGVQAEIQVLAECSAPHLRGEVAVGGRQDADIDLHRRGPAQAVDFALLQCAQQLRLQTDIHFGHLVQQQGAAMGGLELAQTAGDRAGEGASFVAEQLGFQQVFRDRRAVQGDERPSGAARFAVDVAGQHFLAGAGLAADQHRGIGAGDLLGAVHGGLHRRIADDHGMRFAGRGFEDRGDQVGVGRQRQELARPGVDGADGGVGIVAGAAGDDRDGHALGRQRGDDGAHVVRDVAQHQVDVRVGPQPDQCAVGIIGLIELRPARDGDPRRLAEIAGERTDDQYFHLMRDVMTGRDRL
jgi:hypothetical protein